jgi:hypothetical protein
MPTERNLARARRASNTARPAVGPDGDPAGLLDLAEIEVSGRGTGMQDPNNFRQGYDEPPADEDRPAPKRDDS